ncbi:LysE family translocator [Breoghania sp. L-A4]|uniref:LysE family translocator n=1 Tax=Breoghania sp. L-A4 TaxID=2304600 RepID=UPI000E35F9A8|nr:LysE family translocator [Breoghania sp. L-A4]AXS39838.1 LysE family translocator [Breoghania sp. L-A4]
MQDLFGFILAGLALTGSPGPNTLSIAAVGAAFGPRRGAAYLGGILTGMVAVMAVIATGLAGLMLTLPGVVPVVSVAAALYFVYLAWRIASAPPLDGDPAGRREPTFSGGAFVSLVNPKAYAAMAALFSGFALIGAHPVWDVVLKIGVLALIIMLVNIVWLHAGAAMTRFLRSPRASRIVNVTFAVLLLVSVGASLLL